MQAALRITGLTKAFGPVKALTDVSFDVRQGEVHGLIGANGSGKSTLVKILSGYHAPDSGAVRVWDTDVSLPVRTSSRHGLAVIHQDLGLVEQLSVTENVVSSTRFGTRFGQPISWKRQRARVRDLLQQLKIDVDPEAEIGDLSRGKRTLVAVARAICELRATSGERHLLITDEPTSALSNAEATALWDLLRRVTEGGGAALFISHHLNEVLRLCDRVTVLRDGRVVLTEDCAGLSEADLITAMVGSPGTSESAAAPTTAPATTAAVLRAEHLTGAGLSDVSFEIGEGEILGITGLLGMGQEQLPGVFAGLLADVEGTVAVDGRVIDFRSAAQCRQAGIVLVPAERHRDGLWLDGTVAENLGIVRTRSLVRAGVYGRAQERRDASELAERFDVRPRDVRKPIRNLSGGNQQKVLLAKWLQLEPRVVVLHEPTQGVDVAAKRDIHRLIRQFALRTKAAVCIVSSDQDEVAENCDRVLVMAHGRISGELKYGELTTERFMTLASVAR
jgi:ribose transport system ATP-binding protein